MAALRKRRELGLEEDRERRDRGIPLERWLHAPATPTPAMELSQRDRIRRLLALGDDYVDEIIEREFANGRAQCELGVRPCPHLRCVNHIGERGDGSYSCAIDFAELPADERTFERIAEVIGVSQERVVAIESRARDKLERETPDEMLEALGFRRGHAGQR